MTIVEEAINRRNRQCEREIRGIACALGSGVPESTGEAPVIRGLVCTMLGISVKSDFRQSK